MELEKITYKGIKYFLDNRLKQMRQVKNPHIFIHYHDIEVCCGCGTFHHVTEVKIYQSHNDISDDERVCPKCNGHCVTLESAQDL